MKIEFDETLESFQKALLLKKLIEYARSHELVDSHDLDIVADIHQALDQFLEQETFQVYRADEVLSHRFDEIEEPNPIKRLWRSIKILSGPSRQERELSEQRRTLVAKAEQAEIISRETLAEMAEVGRQRDTALEKLAALEKRLGTREES
ncbi:MAG: hypothetical protein ACR2P9_02695 [Gammaproteobacteria bacterium]